MEIQIELISKEDALEKIRELEFIYELSNEDFMELKWEPDSIDDSTSMDWSFYNEIVRCCEEEEEEYNGS